MSTRRDYTAWDQISANDLAFSLGQDRSGKPTICMLRTPGMKEVSMVTPACVTNWPRVNGDGNYGTMFGPADPTKAKFSIDLTDAQINGVENQFYAAFSAMMTGIDDKLLDFVHGEQLKILGRKNLSREEVKMLQIRTVRPKYDKMSGTLIGHTVNASSAKYAYDGMGGKFERAITICDANGAVVPNGVVSPGDVVSATIYANQVYTGVGGDKFGIHWSFEDVAVICQRAKLEAKTNVSAFGTFTYDFAKAYEQPAPPHCGEQFSE
jgi:hypothetical protein